MESQVLIKISKEEFEQMMQQFFSQAIQHSNIQSPEKQSSPTLMSVKELSQHLGVSQVSIHAWKKSGQIPFMRLSGRIFFDLAEVMGAMKQVNRRKV